MDLFDTPIIPPLSLLEKDGLAQYYGTVMTAVDADSYFVKLLHNIVWKNDEAFLFGRHITTQRKVAWYGDRPFAYTYSNTTKHALKWTKTLWELKSLIEALTDENYNACLLNLYHCGKEGMAWHSDSEKELKKGAAITSLSFGAERKFSFKHKKSKEVSSLTLQHGSLLVMRDKTQDHWLHCLPKSKRVTQPRINLTFRSMK